MKLRVKDKDGVEHKVKGKIQITAHTVKDKRTSRDGRERTITIPGHPFAKGSVTEGQFYHVLNKGPIDWTILTNDLRLAKFDTRVGWRGIRVFYDWKPSEEKNEASN